jgi:hypothetical protein
MVHHRPVPDEHNGHGYTRDNRLGLPVCLISLEHDIVPESRVLKVDSKFVCGNQVFLYIENVL